MTNVFSLPISQIAEKIKKSEITCLELCQNYIAQIEKHEKDVKAWAFFDKKLLIQKAEEADTCLLYTSPSPRDRTRSRMPSSA